MLANYRQQRNINLINARKSMNMSGRGFAGKVGINYEMYRRYEKGAKSTRGKASIPNVLVGIMISRMIGVSVEYLFNKDAYKWFDGEDCKETQLNEAAKMAKDDHGCPIEILNGKPSFCTATGPFNECQEEEIECWKKHWKLLSGGGLQHGNEK